MISNHNTPFFVSVFDHQIVNLLKNIHVRHLFENLKLDNPEELQKQFFDLKKAGVKSYFILAE